MAERSGRQLAVLLAMLLSTLLPGCSHKAADSVTTASSDSAEFDFDDPCNLLEPKEVEAVLGAPLAVAPFRGATPDRPSVTSDSCVYTTAGFHFITLEAHWKDGAQIYSLTNMTKKLLGSSPDPGMKAAIKQAFKLDDGTELVGEWDRATLMPMNCCIFVALRGERLLTIDFTGSDATLKQVAPLVDAAFKRFDKPLTVNGGANVAAAKGLAQQRIKPVDPCSLLSRDEVEAILGAKLIADPVGHGTDSCTYELKPVGIRQLYEVQFTWRGGYTKWREDGFISQMAAGTMAKMSSDGAGAEKVVLDTLGNHGEVAGPTWERGEQRGVEFMAVKKDVMGKIDLRGVNRDPAVRLLAAMMARI
jgi:hypothetical protein